MEDELTLEELTDDTVGVWSRMRQDLWDDCDAERNARDYQTYLGRKSAGDSITLLALRESSAIGFIEAEVRKDHVQGALKRPIWYVEGIFVEPEFRLRNVGRRLIRGLAKRVHATELGSDCELDHEDSRLFHEAAGFSEAGRSIHFWMKIDVDGDV